MNDVQPVFCFLDDKLIAKGMRNTVHFPEEQCLFVFLCSSFKNYLVERNSAISLQFAGSLVAISMRH